MNTPRRCTRPKDYCGRCEGKHSPGQRPWLVPSNEELMTPSSHSRLSGAALLGLLFGLAAPFTLVTGPLALYFGYRGLYAVNTSGGRLRGRSSAIIGLILGGLASIAGLIGILALIIAKM